MTVWLRILTALLAIVALAPHNTPAASVETDNFVVTAASVEIAQKTAEAAEQYRRTLAVEWLGREMPSWQPRCSLTVSVQEQASRGFTTYQMNRDGVSGWEIEVAGTLERILDSVLPHELSHTILASHFRDALPRWADEGAAMLAEAETEQQRQRLLFRQVFNRDRRIPLRQLLKLKDYPSDPQLMMAVYGVGHSLAEFLVQSGGKERYLQFLKSAERTGWDPAVRKTYGFPDIEALEKNWLKWVEDDRPALKTSPRGKWVHVRPLVSQPELALLSA